MLEKLEKLSKVLNESYSEKSLLASLGTFFLKNFETEGFSINTDNNSSAIYRYPIYKHKKLIGNLEFTRQTDDLTRFLDLAAPFISLKVQNINLSEKMQKNINFHETMKNIAKIIETQYELNYVIPIIGEMLDKFFENILIYLFLKIESTGSNILVWPGACNDKYITKNASGSELQRLSDDKKTLMLPLKSEGKEVGVIAAKSTDEEISAKDTEYLTQLASQIATTINRANVYAEILKHATLDALTGFYNRRQLEERIKQEVSNAKRQKAPLCGIMTDIDFFKGVNDTYGHAVGDLVLKTIAKIIRGQLREYDIAGRLRKTIENRAIDISKINPDSEVKTLNITLSLGIYEMKENDNDEDLLKKADKALYQAKNTGRNKVVIYNE